MSNSALNELGFAEFVAKLISDTFGAILSSQLEQQDKLSELDELLALPENTFLDMCMQDPELLEQLTSELQALYPADSDSGHQIYKGAPYQAKTQQKPELPDIYNTLGLTLEEKLDYKGKTLTEAGAEKIQRQVMQGIAQKQRALLEGVLTNGVPKLVVDSGKINAKLTFSMQDESSKEKESAPTSSSFTNPASALSFARFKTSNFTIANRFAGIIDPKTLLNTRIKIIPASNRAPQDAQSSANIYSEVEISFKTIL